MLKNAALLLIAILLFNAEAICCSCIVKTKITVEDFNSYDWIFVGKLIKSDLTNSDDYRYRRWADYQVITAYRGVKVGGTIRIYDAASQDACGLGFLERGRNYLIYATGTDRKFTSDCSRTTQVPVQFWPADSTAINRLKSLDFFGRIYDTLSTNFHADTTFLNKHVQLTNNTSTQKFYDEKGKLIAEGKYLKNRPEGHWKYFQNGKVLTAGKYLNGLKDSLWFETYTSRSVYIREYKAGEFTFREQHFFDGRISQKREPVGNGKQWVEIRYHNNEKPRYIAYTSPPKRNDDGELREGQWNGPYECFNQSGITLESGTNKDGRWEGHWKYYYETGRMRMEGDFVKGEKTGRWVIYHHNEKIKASGTYHKDEKEKDWKFYNEKGKEISADPDYIKEDEDWFTYSGVKK